MFHPQLATVARWLKQDLLKRNSTAKLYFPFEPLAVYEPCHPGKFRCHDVGRRCTCMRVLQWLCAFAGKRSFHRRGGHRVFVERCVFLQTQLPSPLEDGGDRGGAVVAIQFPTTMR